MSPIAAAVVPVFVPILFWAGYHYYKDHRLPEPLHHLLLAFALGMGSFWLGMLLYEALGIVGLRYDAYGLALTNRVGLFAYAILAIGMIEEFVKLIPFLIVVLKFAEFDEPIDGIIYASFIALGFAAVENYQYLSFLTPLEALGRGFAGPAVHIVFASVWGFYIGCAKLRGEPLLAVSLLTLAVTAVLHGLYDFIVIAFPGTALPISAAIILMLWIWRLRLIRALHNEADRIAAGKPLGADGAD